MADIKACCFAPPSRKSWLKSTSRSSSAPIKRRPSSSYRGDGSSSELSLGSDDAEGSRRIGKISTARRSPSCASPPSGLCCESYAIPHKLFGQTLTPESQSHLFLP